MNFSIRTFYFMRIITLISYNNLFAFIFKMNLFRLLFTVPVFPYKYQKREGNLTFIGIHCVSETWPIYHFA